MTMDKKGWREFLELCAKFDSPDDLEAMFDLFFTFEEKETLASRTLIIKALIDGRMTQREIADRNKVSIAQITRGSNALKIISPKLKSTLAELLKDHS